MERSVHLDSIKLINFRSFGPEGQTIYLSPILTALVGSNGTGKTVAMQALQRLFGISIEQRAIRKQDFHIPSIEGIAPPKRTLSIEAVISFPELDSESADHSSIPDFFQHMSIADDSGKLHCRLVLDAEWQDDGSLDGEITSKFRAITTFGVAKESDYHHIRPADRSRVQMIYVPATRTASSQVSKFLKGRLWKAINWTQGLRASFIQNASQLNNAFEAESAIQNITNKLKQRWQELHSAGTDCEPKFRPIDIRFEEFVKQVDVLMHPDENGQDRSISELSDGQSSLFHIAMTSATLDMEAEIMAQPNRSDFLGADLPLPSLTILALEEPENSLAPFYLPRIVEQVTTLSKNCKAQSVISSHSPSILSRIEPNQVRYFRLAESNTTNTRSLTLPDEVDEAYKYIQQAVRAYPELYFAKCVILGEGASEEIVIPKVAESLNVPIDRSFVAMVPLGGRHVNHMWRLLSDLNIPYVTLLDLDWGRHGGGWGRIKNAVRNLIDFGERPENILGTGIDASNYEAEIEKFDNYQVDDLPQISNWIQFLENWEVFYSCPLDIDYSLLRSFQDFYQVVPSDESNGPSTRGDPRKAVLGENGLHTAYDQELEQLRWYRYLFLGRGKPSTHMRVLSTIPNESLSLRAPGELKNLIRAVQRVLETN